MTAAGTDRATAGADVSGTLPVLLRRVLLAHPEPLQRRSITMQLRELGVISVVEVGTTVEARLAARSTGPRDLAILGMDPAGPEFGALLAELERQGWSRVVVLMPRAGTQQIVAALLGGATGVLAGPLVPAGASATSTSPGLRLVGPHESGAPAPGPARTAGVRFVPDVRGTPRALSHREQEILQLAADGHPNREIAERLNLSPLTVKSHLGRIGRKLGSGDRAQLVLLALRADAIS